MRLSAVGLSFLSHTGISTVAPEWFGLALPSLPVVPDTTVRTPATERESTQAITVIPYGMFDNQYERPLSLSMIELLNVVVEMSDVTDLQSLLGDMADASMVHRDADGMFDGLFRNAEGLRLLAQNTQLGDYAVLTILENRLRTKMAYIHPFGEFPERRAELVTFWESYSGMESTAILRVLLHGTGLQEDPLALSSLILRSILDQNNSDIKLMDFARLFLERHDFGSWPKFTQEVKDAMSGFWTSRDRNSEVFVLTFIAMSPIMFPEHYSSFCDDLIGAMAVVERIELQKYRSFARWILIDRCPHLAPFEDRAAQLRVPPRSYLNLMVPRERILDQAVEWFNAHTGEELRQSGITIGFVGEDGFDDGGLRREWYHTLGQAIADDKNGILVETESRRLAPSAVGGNVMEFVGKFVALAIIHGQQVPIRLSQLIHRYILEGLDSLPLDMGIYTKEEPTHANSLVWIMENNPSSDGWERATQDLSFSVDLVQDGEHSVHELIEGGAAIPVTDENKADYVQRVIEYKLRQSIRPQLESFLNGFYSVLPQERLDRRFTAEELDIVIAGYPEIDVTDLRAHTQYVGYTRKDKQIVWFWKVVKEFSHEERAQSPPEVLLRHSDTTSWRIRESALQDR
jgi:hypothetical protein